MSATDGRVLRTTKVVDNGPSDKRFDLVILAEGYKETEIPNFRSDVDAFLQKLWLTEPYPIIRRAINVHRVEVASTDSGADEPACPSGMPKSAATYFDATFCTNNVDRLLTVNNALATSTANAQVPGWNAILVLVNSAKYGGAGGAVATCSTHPDAAEIAIHEIGHTVHGFADEYEYYLGCGLDTDKNVHATAEPGNVNVTIQNVRTNVPWVDLISSVTAVPTMANLDCTLCDPHVSPVGGATVGLFEGAHYHHCRCYRPQFNCKMRVLGQPFCAVCNRKIRFDMHPFFFDWQETFRSRWGLGWSIINPFQLGGFNYLLSYNAGSMAIDRIQPHGQGVDTIHNENWSIGWTHIMPFVLNGQPHILSYQIGSGRVAIDRIRPDGQGTDTLYDDTWTSGWSSFVPLAINGHPHYLAYKIGAGQVSIDRIRDDGSGSDTVWSDTWTTGWSAFVPFVHQGQQAMLSYKVGTGQMAMDLILPNAMGTQALFSATWTTGWTTLAPFRLGPDYFFLSYKIGTGQFSVDRIKPDGQGTDTVLNTTWSTGWSTILPVVVDGARFYFAYKIAAGDVCIGPI